MPGGGPGAVTWWGLYHNNGAACSARGSAPLPPATDPLSEHAQLSCWVARRPQPPDSMVQVFQAALEAGLAVVLDAGSRGCDV